MIFIDNGLLQYAIDSQKFRITEKGLSLLKLCEQIGHLIEGGRRTATTMVTAKKLRFDRVAENPLTCWKCMLVNAD